LKSLISVIVPIYNVEDYLDRCIESIVKQTYDNLEIILVDDGSPDNCPEVCDRWADKDERIKVIHKENSGVGMARNAGIDLSCGDYIMFVDSDDYIQNNAVELLYDRLIDDNSDFSIGKHVDAYDDGSINDSFCSWMNDVVLDKKGVISQFGKLKFFSVAPWGKLYKAEIFSDIRFPSISCGEDMWIFSDILEKCSKVSVVNEKVYYYYQRSGSTIHQKSERAKLETINSTLKLTMYFVEQNEWSSAKNWCIRAINEAALLSQPKDGIKIFYKFLNDEIRRELFAKVGFKANLKWKLLFIPYSFKIIKIVKNICFWRKK